MSKKNGFQEYNEIRLDRLLEKEPDTLTLEEYNRREKEDAKQFIPLLPRIGAIY